MIFLALLVVAAVLLIPDLYIYLVFLRHTDILWQVLHWLPAAVMLLSLGYTLLVLRHGGVVNMQIGSLVLACMLCFGFPKLLFMLFSLLGKLGGLAWSPLMIGFNWAGVGVAIVFSLSMLYGLTFGWRSVTVKHVDLSFDNLPAAFEGYRIAQLSDLHVGTYLHAPKVLQKIVDKTNEQHADAIVFTGDIVNTNADELPPFAEMLGSLHTKDGVYSVLGNHDYCMMGNAPQADPRAGARAVVETERRMGWDILLNEHRVIRRGNDSIAFIGVENTGKPPFPQVGNLRGAMQGVAGYATAQAVPDAENRDADGLPAAGGKDIFSILLSHDPSHWRMEVLPNTQIPLMLAGHTHAAQIKIGKWSLSQYFYPEWGGLYKSKEENGKIKAEGEEAIEREGNVTSPQASPHYLYVSEGTGGSFPFRLGTRPEIVVITLHKK